MSRQLQQQTAALAAIVMSLEQVLSIARHGRIDTAAFHTCLAGLLAPYEGDVLAAYGGVAALRPGLDSLATQLHRPDRPELSRYLILLLHLERKLARHRAMLAHLGDGLAQARQQREYFGEGHENVVKNLAGLYTETVSTLRPKVMIQGERVYLQDAGNAERIRALLLAGVRAASLWRAQGGSRLKLLFRRAQLLENLERLRSDGANPPQP
ncbi:high frequency lysogenization protein HflD [Alkalilimnicola sp. S0819]|uniref:high frequency lysogenization protein HflD n=1 Tax=Alkalilimnicola sp. S0819 TaxID=2613922 RepID=UPI0012618318|nr:high frequency lysogenization protein HflD [Alkalilimnicola sp. S0819]KAB7627507.1 high frequency lysogenization protein HflD [Alkalilimnicola sp. S0819]MPQ15661.1 high frequency lysogenization protein HflD [Alkalilimnicola sp. S0819]